MEREMERERLGLLWIDVKLPFVVELDQRTL